MSLRTGSNKRSTVHDSMINNNDEIEEGGDKYGDEAQMAQFGYRQTLHRTWNQFESFMAAFGALYIVGGARILYSIGISAGGPYALWTSMLVTVVCMTITAASLAEICSALPLSGSIYIWAAEAAGKKYGRFFGFVVAFWSTTAWTSFIASNSQATTNFMLTELVVFNVDFPGGLIYDNINFRALVWICSELFLFLAIWSNLLGPGNYKYIFKFSAGIILIDFLLTMIWLPVGVSKTYGFQDVSFLTTTYNGTGAGDAWNWILSFLATSGVLTGFDASGHVSEEVQNSSLTSARGMFWSCAVSALLSIPLLFLFLFCSPDLETLFSIEAPQPFVVIYDLALGRGGQLIMTVVATIGLFINTSIAILAASRLVYGIARDGVLPGSGWIGKVDENGQPRNAILFVGGIAAILLCTILPSTVAFTSLVSAGACPTIAAYALIPTLRLIFTRGEFTNAKWSTGRFSTLFCIIAAVFNTFLLTVLFSPYSFPVTAQTFNFASVIFVFVTLLGIISYFVIPEEQWLSSRTLARMHESDLNKSTTTNSTSPSSITGETI